MWDPFRSYLGAKWARSVGGISARVREGRWLRPTDASKLGICSVSLLEDKRKSREAREARSAKIRPLIASPEPTQGGELLWGSLYLL